MVAIPRHRRLLLLYFRYKDSPLYLSSVIGTIFVVSFLLLWKVVIPQVDAFISVSNEVQNTKDRITILKNNITYLTSLSSVELDNELQLAFGALPSEKDFAGIIDAIGASALKSGVVVNDYSIAVGELATPSAKLKQYYSVDLALTVNGNKDASKDFLNQIQNTLPVAQVKTVSLTEDSSSMKISFYFKPFPKGTYKATQPITAIPQKAAAIVNTISLWKRNQVAVSQQSFIPPDSSLGSPF